MCDVDFVQVKAVIPRQLKRRAFLAFAMQDEKFSRWLRRQLEGWLEEVAQSDEERAIPEINSD